MKEIVLNKTDVVFRQEDHSYWLGDKRLDGVTKMLHNQLFPDEFNGIPEDKLKHAAEEGSSIHELCELYDTLGVKPKEPNLYLNSYIVLCEQNNLVHLDSEYLVTNNESHASSIDKVFYGETENGVIIADIKHTSKLNENKTSWQVSIYKEWFEKMNPELHVEKVIAIWLPNPKYGCAQIRELKVIPGEQVNFLIMAEQEGLQYQLPKELAIPDDSIPVEFVDLEAAIYGRLAEIKQLEQEAEDFKKRLKEAMESVGAKSWKSDRMTISITKDTTTTTFDSKKFKEENPEEYAKYQKKSIRKGSLTIKLK